MDCWSKNILWQRKENELAYNEDGVIELYDLVNGLVEQNNLAKTMPKMANQLRDTLQRWRKQIDAQMMHKSNL